MVRLKRTGSSLDEYVLSVGGTVSRLIRIRNRQDLIDLYKQGLRHDGSDRPITWTIAGTDYTFDYKTACGVFGSVQDWFWDYVDAG